MVKCRLLSPVSDESSAFMCGVFVEISYNLYSPFFEQHVRRRRRRPILCLFGTEKRRTEFGRIEQRIAGAAGAAAARRQ